MVKTIMPRSVIILKGMKAVAISHYLSKFIVSEIELVEIVGTSVKDFCI